MSDDDARTGAEERVRLFLADYDERWRRAAPRFEDPDRSVRGEAFTLWRTSMAEAMASHLTSDSREGLASSFGTPAQYGAGVERIDRSDVDGDTVYVLTDVFAHPLDMRHEYTVRREGSEWRIASIAQHFRDPVLPFVEPDAARALAATASTDAPFEAMPAAQAPLDETRNFTDRDVVRPGDGVAGQARVEPIGTLVTASGVLAVLDFGYDNADARPLARTVPPGSYPVERVTAFDRNAGIRVRIGDGEPVAWHPASLSTGPGHVIGVDAGSACVVDYPAYAGMSRRAKAAAFDLFGHAERPAALPVTVDGADIGIAVESGYGDGSYPAYWGVNADGAIVQLVVDFMVLVAQDEAGTLHHL